MKHRFYNRSHAGRVELADFGIGFDLRGSLLRLIFGDERRPQGLFLHDSAPYLPRYRLTLLQQQSALSKQLAELEILAQELHDPPMAHEMRAIG